MSQFCGHKCLPRGKFFAGHLPGFEINEMFTPTRGATTLALIAALQLAWITPTMGQRSSSSSSSSSSGTPGAALTPNVWTQINVQPLTPPDLQYHTATALGGVVVVFGGVNPVTFETYNTTWLLNLTTQVWTFCAPSSAGQPSPPTRVLHTMVAVTVTESGNSSSQQLGLMFGGLEYPSSQTLNDTWLFNPSNCSWSQVDAAFPGLGRSGHGAVSLSNTTALVLGGCANATLPFTQAPFCQTTLLNDVFLFNMTSRTWTEAFVASPFIQSFLFNALLVQQPGEANATLFLLFGVPLIGAIPQNVEQIFFQAELPASFATSSNLSLHFEALNQPTVSIIPRPAVIVVREGFLVVGFSAESYTGGATNPTVWLMDRQSLELSQPRGSSFSSILPALVLIPFVDGSCAVPVDGMLYHGFGLNMIAILNNAACSQPSQFCEKVCFGVEFYLL